MARARDRRAWPAIGAPALMKLQLSSNSRNSWRDTPASNRCREARGEKEVPTMGFGLRSAVALLALTSASLVSSPSWAGDDGDAPLWKGVGWDFRSNSRSGGRVRFWWGKAPSDRLSRTRQARPAAEYGFAAARFLRNCGSLLAREPRDPAQESAEGRGKEIDRRGGRCASALHARVSGERACDGSLG